MVQFKPVTKEEFYSKINSLNVHPQIQPGKHPYTSLWKTPDRKIVGKSVGRSTIDWCKTGVLNDYFLPVEG